MKNVLPGKSKPAFLLLCAVFVLCFFHQAVYCQKNRINRTNSVIQLSGDLVADEFKIFDLVNAERTKRGLNELIFVAEVADIARAYSKKMAEEDFFSHYDFDGNSVLERAKAAHLKHWSKIGENLFSVENLTDFDAFAVKNWMKSPAHRENILDRDWTATGIGIAKSKDGEIFITQIFIKR